MIAWYSYLGNMIARQTIRYEVPRGLFLFSVFSVFSVWARNKIVLSVLVDGHVQERIFGLTPEELARYMWNFLVDLP